MMIHEKKCGTMGDGGTRGIPLQSSHQVADKHAGIGVILTATAVLTEGPAGAQKTVKLECVRQLLAEIQMASHAPTARGDSLPELMGKLMGKVGDLEAILASSPPSSGPAENAMACLDQILKHLPGVDGAVELKARVEQMLQPAVTA
jgi:hypothetical protein